MNQLIVYSVIAAVPKCALRRGFSYDMNVL